MTGESAAGNFDVVIVGGGITGMCLGWFLADAGLRVAIVDHGRDSGSTANAGSMHVQMQSRLVRLFPERIEDYKKTLSLYPQAVDFWQEIAARLDEDVELVIKGGLMVAESADDLAFLERKCEIERHHGLRSRVLDRNEMLEVAPYLSDQLHGASYCEQEGKINPLKANRAIEKRVRQAGIALHRECTVEDIRRTATGFELATTAGTLEAERIVIAAGAGSGKLAGQFGHRIPARGEPLHMNITEAAEPIMTHLVQHASRPITLKQLGSGHVVIGGGWPAAPGDDIRPPRVLSESVVGNVALAGEIAPRIASLRLLRTWAGVNPLVDLLSVLGELPGEPGVFVAVPGDCGYTLGPICARLVADKMLELPERYPLEHFAPQRF